MQPLSQYNSRWSVYFRCSPSSISHRQKIGFAPRRTLLMFGPLPPLRLVYFSSIPSDFTNMVAGSLQQGGAEILLMVVTPGPSARPNENYKDVVAHKLPGVDILVTSHPKRLAPMLRELKPDLIFVTGFPYRLPAELLSL